MSRTTPTVEAGMLHDRASATTLALGSDAWFAWLADEQHHSFHFVHRSGGFTARKERKQRGQWYWVAYRQAHCKLHKVYLGKTDTLTEHALIAASEALARAADATI